MTVAEPPVRHSARNRSATSSLPATVARPGPGQRFAMFCHRYIRQTKGRWAGQPLILEDFQRDFADELFEVDPATGLRVYQEALLGIPRKNGKSTLAAALSLYLLIADDEQSPEVYNSAAAKGQATIVFDQVKAYVLASPALQDFVTAYQYHIACPENRGVIRVLASDAELQHGLNPSGNVIDELHAHKSGDLYTALTSGSGAREQPMTVTITTAGYDEEQVLGQIYNKALDRPELIEQPTPYLTIVRDRANGFLMYWFSSPTDDLADLAAFKGANPAPWITEDYLRRQRDKPSTRPNEYRRLHGNRWTEGEDDWLEPGAWEACEAPDVPLRLDLPLAVGIDKAKTHDYSAIVVAQDQPERLVVRAKFWANPYPEDHRLHDQWELDGEEIRDELRKLFQAYPMPAGYMPDHKTVPAPGPAFAYDEWQFQESAQILRGEGLNMIRYDQHDATMAPAARTTYEQVKTARLAHDGNPTLAQHLRNVRALERGERGWRLEKPKGSRKRIDGAKALTMAVHQAMKPAPPPRQPRHGKGF